MQRSRTRSRTPDASPGVGEPRVSAPRVGLRPRAAPAESAPRAEAPAAGGYAIGGKPRAAERVRPAETRARTRVHVPGCVAGPRTPRHADGSTPAPGRWVLAPPARVPAQLPSGRTTRGPGAVARAPASPLDPRLPPASAPRRHLRGCPAPLGPRRAARALRQVPGWGRRARQGAQGPAQPRAAPAPSYLLPGGRRREEAPGGEAAPTPASPRRARPAPTARPAPRRASSGPRGNRRETPSAAPLRSGPRPGPPGEGAGAGGVSPVPRVAKGLQGNCSRNVRLRSSFSGATIGYIKNNT